MPFRRGSTTRRKGPRSRGEVEAERQELLEETGRAIDAIVAEFHARLPREQARAVGAAYARYSSRFQHSVADQVRGLLEAALAQVIFVPREFVFYDLAVRGAKERRPGLDGLRAVLKAKSVQAVLIFTTNRLFRKTYKALQFVEEQVVGRGIRCIFVKSGVDSNDEKRWRMMLQVHAMTDEFVTGIYADNIRVGHEGLFDKRLVFGTITFGYRAKEVPGAPTRRKRPRCEYEVDPDAADWVKRAFGWYVDEGVSIAEVIRRLNADPKAPLGPKALSGRWTRLAVRLLLANPRYVGRWLYGRTVTVWQNQQDYSRQVPREQPLREKQFDELRIVDDATWRRAQQRLAEAVRDGGRRPKGGDRRSRPRLLNGLFVCAAHGRRLHVGGAYGHTMFCPVCQGLPADRRPLFTTLNRVVALRLTCQRLAELVRSDAALVTDITAACQKEAEAGQRADPARPAELNKRVERLSQQIRFILDNPGETEADRAESTKALRRLRAEREAAAAELSALEAAGRRPLVVPDEQQVRALLAELDAVLLAAAAGDDGRDAAAARQAIEALTGGKIELTQMGERKARRGWLRGQFRVNVVDYVAARQAGVTAASGGGIEVTIDYREPSEPEAWADRVKALYDQGRLVKAIAAELGITRNLARNALACWFARRGPEAPDGRSRRSGLATKHLEPPTYQQVADEVKELLDGGLLMQEVAERLGLDRNTVTSAVRHWYDSRGLPVPDGRARRKSLGRDRTRPQADRREESGSGSGGGPVA
jgi:site-specific DNA recombinase